ncbi:MAG: hypothetical protein EOM88_04575 [Clostridia bacterium]|nr:hypothetical protein [Clostridia bacterium]
MQNNQVYYQQGGGDEIYKDIPGYEGNYKISNYGRVISLKRKGTIKINRYLSIQKNIDGYSVCVLYKNNTRKMLRVCRLVAQTFISNKNNLPCVNHKDQSKDNDYYKNLEWCSVKYNANYGDAIKRSAIKRGKPVGQYDLKNKLSPPSENMKRIDKIKNKIYE